MRAIAILAFVLIPGALFAQEVGTIADELVRGVMPLVIQAIGALLGLALTWAAVTFKAKTGLDIEAERREALHAAIMTGVSSALTKLGDGANPATVAQEAIAHARASVPDAIAALKPGVDVLTNIALGKLEALLAVKAAPAVAPLPTPITGA